MIWANKALLFNLRSAESLPFDLGHGHMLAAATSEEVDSIRTVLSLYEGEQQFGRSQEVDWEQNQTPGRVNIVITDRPREAWRYFIISPPQESTNNRWMVCIESALSLMDDEVQVLFTFNSHAGKVVKGINPLRFAYLIHSNQSAPPTVDLTTVHLEQVRRLTGMIEGHDHGVLPLDNALSDFRYLGAFDPDGRMSFLGHFTVIESLLTHNPNPGDPYESLGRQINRKMALVNNRPEGKLPFERFFSAPYNTKTIWSRLYTYRSLVAHGAPTDFSKGDLRLLVDAKTALAFIRQAARALIRFGLHEPELLRDLKEV